MAQKMENREAPPVVVTAQVVSGSFVTEANVIPPNGVATATVPSTANHTGVWKYENHTGVWKYDVFGRCCSCESDCWMAWCCACFPLAQIAGKLQAEESNALSAGCLGPAYKETLIVYFGLFFLGLMLTIFAQGLIPIFAGDLIQSPSTLTSLYLFIVACQARKKTRRYHQIHADDCNDCCCSWWCLPCVITQLYECNHYSIHAFLL